jgi:peroxiredoxin
MPSLYAIFYNSLFSAPPKAKINDHQSIGYLPLVCVLFIGLWGTACNDRSSRTVIEGQIRSTSEPAEISLEKEHIHYKFSDPVLETQQTDEEGRFRFEFENLELPAVYQLQYRGESHPVYVEPGRQQFISFNSASFPELNETRGGVSTYYEAYQKYIEELAQAEQHLREEQRKMRENKENDVLNIHRLKIKLAKEYLADTPFSYRIKRHLGEFLTASMEHIDMLYQGAEQNAEALVSYRQRRQEILDIAHQYDFFTRSSLEAQRAGIRDFAATWVETAALEGISARATSDEDGNEITSRSIALLDSVFSGNEQERIAREMKWHLISEIEQEDARRYAVMYLIAEELGEGDFKTGSELLRAHAKFLETEPRLLSFLETLRDEVARTQPGKPAIAFSIPDENGEQVTLNDFEGQYVLLDFWASWCMPCINAFPELERLYNNHEREDFEIVSISVEENEGLWRSALQRFPKPWTQLYDGTGFDQETFTAYRAGSIPFYVLIDRDGTIIRNNDFKPAELPEILEEQIENENATSFAQN